MIGGGTVDEGEPAQQANSDESAAQPGVKWGDPISEERQTELRALFERQKAWVARPKTARGESAFRGVRLTGADVFWLVACVLAEKNEGDGDTATERIRYNRGDLSALHLEGAQLYRIHLEDARLYKAHLKGANLYMAHLERADLRGAHLKDAGMMEAHLEGAKLCGAHLQDAILSEAHLEGVDLWAAHIEGGNFIEAHLEGADLRETHLEEADLRDAHLEGADLRDAHLEGTVLRWAHLGGQRYSETDGDRAALDRIRAVIADFPDILQPADLRLAFFDHATMLAGATFGDADLGYVRVADTRWGDVNLAVVDWSLVPVLGDELTARWRKDKDGKPKDRKQRLKEFTAAVRANRVLAITLRSQGMNEDADRYAYRAQLLHRTVLRLRRRWGAAFGSWLLDLISGYGYKPVRSVIAYITIILFFATLYLINGQFAAPHLRWDEALILSISSFHGRGFFTSGISLGDTLARLAAGEAIIGLLIEITFIATFTQRFFAR